MKGDGNAVHDGGSAGSADSAGSAPKPPARCYLGPLIEPLRDGRLDDAERRSIERHLAECASCRALLSDLARIGALAAGAALAPSSALDHRRGRMRLLQEAALLDPSAVRTTLGGLTAATGPVRVGWARPVAAAAAALIALAGAGRSRSVPRAATPADPAPLTASAPAASAPVVVPAVAAARVDLPAAPANMGDTPMPPSAPPPPARRASPRAVPLEPAASGDPALSRAGGGTSREELAGGVGALEQGNFGEAVERLGAFRKSHPGDARSEDAAFLTIVALQRAGRRAEAVLAARDYLQSYPSGYRRAEAQRIARGD
jgi:hypothetical protein